MGGVFYDASPSFMTLLRYRLMFDESYLTGHNDDLRSRLIDLVYAGIKGDKPDYYTFVDEARVEKGFMTAAHQFSKKLLRSDYKTPPKQRNNDEGTTTKEYEYAVLSAWAAQGLYFPLLEEMTLSQATHLMQVCVDVKNPQKRAKPMTKEQRAQFYGITPDREAAVLEYLKNHPEVQ